MPETGTASPAPASLRSGSFRVPGPSALRPTSAARRASFAVISERRMLRHDQPKRLCGALRAQGHAVELIDADAFWEGDREDGLGDVDLVVARGSSDAVIALLQVAEAKGTPVLSRSASLLALRDRADMVSLLAAGGIPMPATYFGSIRYLANHLPRSSYPLALRRVAGDEGNLPRIVADPRQLGGVEWADDAVLAQSYPGFDGHGLKLYAIGSRVWAVRRWPRQDERGPGSVDHMAVTEELRTLARRCGQVFGLQLLGIDCVMTSKGPLVSDVTHFPNYSWVAGIEGALAAHLVERVALKS